MSDNRVQDLLSVWQRARAAGQDPPAEELCRDAPELVSDLAAAIAALRGEPLLAETNRAPRSTVETPTATWANGDVPPRVGEFRVIRLLGQGGMGIVYLAVDPRLGREVAVKVLRPEVAVRLGYRERFLREARAAAQVAHDHVVPIWHVGEDDGTLYIVMPLLVGETLDDHLRRDPTPPTGLAARVAAEVAEGLAAAHAKGVVHRDIKPANVWLEADASGEVRKALVLDFGLARPADAPELTESGVLLGTPGYMAPEQAYGDDPDPRADLFSLGCVLYRMLAGRRPFEGKSLGSLLQAVAVHHPDPPHTVRPVVPVALSNLTMRLLSKSAADRPASAADVARELRLAVEEPPTRIGRPPARRRWWAVGVAVAAVLITVAVVLIRGCPDPVPTVSSGTPPDAAPVEPLRVSGVGMKHFARRPDDKLEPRGELGRDSFTPRLRDHVTVEAPLSRPAYAFLIACRPDGVIELCFPESDREPPPRTDRVTYPSKSRDLRYGLNEGTGLWVFVVVATDDPLPAYRDWEPRRTIPWPPKAELVPSGTVWIDDGKWVDAVGPLGSVRGSRGAGEVVPGQGAVVRVTDALKAATPRGVAAAVGFVVDPRD